MNDRKKAVHVGTVVLETVKDHLWQSFTILAVVAGAVGAALVPPLALAAVAAGADGLLIEVHDRPAAALSDAAQSLSCTAFAELAEKIKKVREAIEA